MKAALTILSAVLAFAILEKDVNATIVLPTQSATITDENGDGTPETVGFGFGHPGDPNYGTTLVQKSPGYERRSVEEFSLSGISAVQSAALTFYFRNAVIASSTFETFVTNGDGQVQLSDFSSISPSLGSRSVPGNQSYFISYDVTSQLNSLLSGGATFVSVSQQVVGTQGGDEVYSSQLTVTTVPEPASAILCVLGGLSILHASRQRKKTALHF